MTPNRPPAVSIIITVLNGGDLACAAVRSMLAQTLEDVEVIVVDDGSTDGTPDGVRNLGDPRIRLVAHPRHYGRTRCLNQAIGMSGGELVAIMDSDDLSFPDRLACQADVLRRNPRLDLVGSRMLRVDTAGAVLFA